MAKSEPVAIKGYPNFWGKKTALMMSEFCVEINSQINVSQTTARGNQYKNVAWKCREHDLIWFASVAERLLYNRGCETCELTGDSPEDNVEAYGYDWGINMNRLVAEWDYPANARNGNYRDDANDDRYLKVTWYCLVHGNHWSASLTDRIAGESNCPECDANRAETVESALAKSKADQ